MIKLCGLILFAVCFDLISRQPQALGGMSVRSPWQDVSLPIERRVLALVSNMTVEEKISQLSSSSAAIDHLDIPAFNWWTECLHGMWMPWDNAKAATFFPQPIGLAATWDTEFVGGIASIISEEMRAINNEQYSKDKTYRGLNCFGPNINIFRDPRWGRGSETYGEDPHLTSRMGVAFVKGLQSEDPAYIKVGATCKHFAAYSLENSDGYSRLSFNASVSQRDAVDTYLPAFEACVTEGHAQSVMCSYNAVNGVPTCASRDLLQKHLRQDWTFPGMVVSDCGSVEGVSQNHKFAKSLAEGAADTLKAGTDMSCADYSYLKDSLKEGLVGHIDIDMALIRVLTQRFKLGMFDPPELQPWSSIPMDVVGSQHHVEVAEEAVRRGSVLLKNKKTSIHHGAPKTLPLDASKLKKVSVLGPFAHSPEMLLGNYYGTPAGHVTTPFEAVKAYLGDKAEVSLHLGTRVTGYAPISEDAINACREVDVCIFFVGSSMIKTHEQAGPADMYTMWSGTTEGEGFDRSHIKLPGSQEEIIKAAAVNTDTPIVVVLVHGGPLDVSWMHKSDRIGAIMSAWYPGQGAAGIADLLFGKVSPSGKLPITFYYNNYTEIQSMSNMDMRSWPGRTYRYLQEPEIYPFSHGLSYTAFEYRSLGLRKDANALGDPNAFIARVEVHNTGDVEAAEVVHLFVAPSPVLLGAAAGNALPQKTLKGFARIVVKPGQHQAVELPLASKDFQFASSEHAFGDSRGLQVVAGDWLVQVGSEEISCSVSAVKPLQVISRLVTATQRLNSN
uniref:Putative extracellular protein TR9_010 n=1 Tax=Trebouxia lynnae TaxID=1825957 RepID=A0A7L9QEL9_9CHLO|nr:putative extracellular protein TR9_010 [Trebouxia lynnae]